MKFLAGTLIVLSVMFQYRIWFSDANVRSLSQLKEVVVQQEQENQRLAARNKHLAADVTDLKRGHAAYEELARMELGMIGENESFVQIIEYN